METCGFTSVIGKKIHFCSESAFKPKLKNVIKALQNKSGSYTKKGKKH
jgi:hypothetical protein